LEERRVLSNVEPGYLAKMIPSEAPEEGQPWDSISNDFERVIMPGVTHWSVLVFKVQNPHFLTEVTGSTPTSLPSSLPTAHSQGFLAKCILP
jgi:aromatic-L-amino-acid/L-tryptophan decarboxylase